MWEKLLKTLKDLQDITGNIDEAINITEDFINENINSDLSLVVTETKEKAKSLIESMDSNNIPADWLQVLHKNNAIDIVELIIKKIQKIDIDLIKFTVSHKYDNILDQLIEAKPILVGGDDICKKALYDAIIQKNEKLVRSFITLKPILTNTELKHKYIDNQRLQEFRDYANENPESDELIKIFNVELEKDISPLYLAIATENLEITELLCKHGAYISNIDQIISPFNGDLAIKFNDIIINSRLADDFTSSKDLFSVTNNNDLFHERVVCKLLKEGFTNLNTIAEYKKYVESCIPDGELFKLLEKSYFVTEVLEKEMIFKLCNIKSAPKSEYFETKNHKVIDFYGNFPQYNEVGRFLLAALKNQNYYNKIKELWQTKDLKEDFKAFLLSQPILPNEIKYNDRFLELQQLVLSEKNEILDNQILGDEIFIDI